MGGILLNKVAGLRPRLVSRLTSPRPVRQAAASCRQARLVVTMGLKGVENFDCSFELEEEAQEVLTTLLTSERFAQQLCEQCSLKNKPPVEFTGMLFQPVPWSMNTPKGMPKDFEKYLDDPNYVVINVPPNYMFQAKILKPSRLCAIFTVRHRPI